MTTERNLYSLEHKRLAKRLREAALAHIRREFALTHEILIEAIDLVDWAKRPEWRHGRDFLELWSMAVKAEQAGEALSVAPAAWIHLAQELASLLDAERDWISYLRLRWATERGAICSRWRLIYGTLGGVALLLGALIIGTMTHSIYAGELTLWFDAASPTREQIALGLLTLGRILGSLMMVEHGFYWSRKAFRGTSDETEAVFLPAEPAAMALLP